MLSIILFKALHLNEYLSKFSVFYDGRSMLCHIFLSLKDIFANFFFKTHTILNFIQILFYFFNFKTFEWIKKVSKRGSVTKVTEEGKGERTGCQKKNLLSDATRTKI